MTAFALHHSPGGSLVGAVRARLHARALDRDLASGVVSWRSPRHATRALQLTSRRRRDGLAKTLERTLDNAHEPKLALLMSSMVMPCRRSVLGCVTQFADLAACLRGPEPVAAEGVARMEALLCDGSGSLYTPNRSGELQRSLHQVKRCLAVAS